MHIPLDQYTAVVEYYEFLSIRWYVHCLVRVGESCPPRASHGDFQPPLRTFDIKVCATFEIRE